MQNRGKNYAGQSTTSWMWGISREELSSSKGQSRSSWIGTTSRACTCSAGWPERRQTTTTSSTNLETESSATSGSGKVARRNNSKSRRRGRRVSLRRRTPRKNQGDRRPSDQALSSCKWWNTTTRRWKYPQKFSIRSRIRWSGKCSSIRRWRRVTPRMKHPFKIGGLTLSPIKRTARMSPTCRDWLMKSLKMTCADSWQKLRETSIRRASSSSKESISRLSGPWSQSSGVGEPTRSFQSQSDLTYLNQIFLCSFI